ncbi:MAG TPA: hypothetical protein DCW29_23335 [Janthinobacterium sp.]|nr:hypothetical protein [Janthinobacterium sp.]
MTIERLPTAPAAVGPHPAQRPDSAPATPLAPPEVAPQVPLAPFTSALPGTGTDAPPYLSRQTYDRLAAANEQGDGGAPAGGALRPDQLFLSRQVFWGTPDPAALAASWRVMFKTYAEQRAALEEQARGRHVPAQVWMSEQGLAAPRADPAEACLPQAWEAWCFAVYGWGSQRLILRALPGQPERGPGARRRRAKVALRLELRLPGAGRVALWMEAVADGVTLELAAADADTMHLLRRLLPELVAAIAAAGTRVLRCRIGPPPPRQRHDAPPRAALASLTPPLLRAMAEAAVLLSRPRGAAVKPGAGQLSAS